MPAGEQYVTQAVFVSSIVKRDAGGVIVTASNGSNEGPPLVRFSATLSQAENFKIGQRLRLTVEDWPAVWESER